MAKTSNLIFFLLCTTLAIKTSAQNHAAYESSIDFPFGQVNPDAPNELSDFADLIGECDCKSVRRTGQDWGDTTSMVWRFKYIMNGMAVQDEVIRSDGKHAGSIRQYNPDSLLWYVHYYSSNFPINKLSVWEGNKTDKGDIVLFKEQKSPNGIDGYYRITFSEISKRGFNWDGDWISKDASIVFPTWKIACTKKNMIGHTVQQITRDQKSIPISLWYPVANSGNAPKSTYQNYVNHISSEKTEKENRETYLRILNSFEEIDTTIDVDDFLNTRTEAYENAPSINQKHPLILICGANPIYHIELAEKLASKGYVVASFPRLGKQKGERLSFDTQGSAEFQEDIKAVVHYLSKKPYIDTTHLSFVTWSFEGIPCLEYAQSNAHVKLFLSFDSSIGYDYGGNLLKNKKFAFEQNMNFPVIHYTSSKIEHGKNFDFLNTLEKQKNPIQINKNIELSHGEFTSILSIDIAKLKMGVKNSNYLFLLDAAIEEIEKLLPVE